MSWGCITANAKVQVRPATPSDAQDILRIYAPFVRDTAISFEVDVPSVTDIANRIENLSTSHGYWVAEQAGQVLGYAYGSSYRPRPAYNATAEVSAYVDPTAQGTGVGRALYETLLADLKSRGFHTAIAVITLPNDSSCALHGALGFEQVGITREVGRKFDRWHDIALWQKPLA